MKKTIRLHGERYLRRLPSRVAHEEGLFEAEGLRVEWLEPDPVRDASEPEEVRHRIKESLLEAGQLDIYKVCQWGGIKRAAQSEETRIFAVEEQSSSGLHAILARPDADIKAPQDLAGKAIGVSRDTGSFYRVLEALERYLPAGAIRTVHAGAPLKRFRALLAGELEAAEFMDLLVPLGELKGLVMVMEEAAPRPGVLVARHTLPRESLSAFMRAWNGAVDRINGEPQRYAARAVAGFLEKLPAELVVPGPELERRFRFPVFTHIRPYLRQEFTDTRDWMLRHGLIDEGVGFRRVVVEGLG